jgi:myo-inositol 2-dehydrogenase / D-chiro-inositol 1-dehydrogenase
MIDRRSFIVLPLAAVAGSAANDSITVGLLGTGNRGPFVASMMAKNTRARIVALCDVFPEKMEKAKATIGVENPRLYTDFHKMLASDIDAIIIATPVFLHAEHFEAALKAGKHIYIEKPASVDVAGCKRIMQLADSADRKLNITFGFQRRSGEVYLKAKKLVDSGALGPIRIGFARFIKSGGAGADGAPSPRPVTQMEKIKNWGAWKDLSGDLIVENNIHSVDVLNWFLGGRPASAIGSGGTTAVNKGDSRDHNFVAFEYPGGVQGQLSGTTLAPPGYRDVAEQFFGVRGFVETSENHWRYRNAGGNDVVEKSPRNITIDSVANFVKHISDNTPENTAVRGAESTLSAILGRMAMDKRREVTWEEMMRSDQSPG